VKNGVFNASTLNGIKQLLNDWQTGMNRKKWLECVIFGIS